MDYVSEVELKSLIIRIKNSRRQHNTVKSAVTIVDNTTENVKLNKYINQKIKLLERLSTTNSSNPRVSIKKLKTKIKNRIIDKSDKACIDSESYEHFGKIVMLIIDRIIGKAQFRGYSYHDDFKSDASFKILKYLDNFDHNKISSITNLPVSAFAYISTIIHNSFVHIKNKKKETNEFIHKQILMRKAKLGMLDDFINERNPIVEDKSIKNIVYIDSNFNLVDVCKEYIEKYQEELNNNDFNIEIVCDKKFDIDDYAFVGSIRKDHKNVKIIEKA